MRKEEKTNVVETISAQLKDTPDFYITDISGLNAGQTSYLRRECFGQGIKLVVVKNTLLQKALEALGNEDYKDLFPTLKGNTAVMFTQTPNGPAKLIKKVTTEGGLEKPTLKGAFVQECAFVGEDKLDVLCNIKSREELIGDIIGLLQSPVRNVVSALEGAGQKIAGIVKTLSEKE